MRLSTKRVKVGLFGLGTVGRGFYDLVQELSDPPIQIERIRDVREINDPGIPQELLAQSAEEILEDGEIEIVVEVIDDADAALEIAREALKKGKTFVTANKKMVATHLLELVELERDWGGRLLYEASVCGNIPILRILETYYQDVPISAIYGIFNGSTNYILSRMMYRGEELKEALIAAQALGFAERDPKLDLSGEDARNKLAILIRHAFGEYLSPVAISREGIEQVTLEYVEKGLNRGEHLRLVARAERIGSQVKGKIELQFVDSSSPLYRVDYEENVVVVETEAGLRQVYRGLGAGARPTGEAVLADVIASLRGERYRELNDLVTA
ncbi:MAG: homoserine dehydrogenase [Candidatus Kapaibacterium sp.]